MSVDNLNALDLALHDAVLDLRGITVEGGVWRAIGELEGIFEKRLARFRFEIEFLDVVSWELKDAANVGEFFIDGVEATPSGLRLTSPLPMEVSIRTASRAFRFTLQQEPSEVRRWFRWVRYSGMRRPKQ